MDKTSYMSLVQRYKELELGNGGSGGADDIPPYDLKPHITEINTNQIDADYMNSKFVKYLKVLDDDNATKEELEQLKAELHKTFATLSSEEQKYANIILVDIESGNLKFNADNKTLRDYITEYMTQAKNDQIHKLADAFGLDETKLRELVELHVNENNLNEFNRFDNLIKTVNKQKAKQYFEEKEQTTLILPKVNTRVSKFLQKFIIEGGFDI